jgi:predicted GNAT family acetyltransferase
VAPTVVRHAPSAFRSAVEAFLLENEAMNNLVLGLAHTLAQNPAAYSQPPYLATVGEGGAVRLAALRTPPYPLVLSTASPPDPPDAVVEALVADVHAAFDALSGVSGPQPVVDRFLAAWEAETGQRRRLQMAERIYELTEVVRPRPVAGRLREATPDDRALLVRWLSAFIAEAAPGEPASPEAMVERRFQSRSDGFVFWEDGEPVALAGFSGPTPTGIRVGPVYTPPDRRGRGYAGALVAALSERLLASGRQRCFLFTDLANPTSNALYQRIGYRPVGDFDQFALE